jgi:uncharacterized membrane protein
MSLIVCPDCAQQVSSLAPACPSCGRPLAMVPAAAYGYSPASVDRVAQARQTVQIGYGLYAGSYLVGPLVFAAVILAYVNRDSVRGTWLESHYDWIIDTFWAAVVAAVLGGAFMLFWIFVFFPIGIILAVVLGLTLIGWPIYRLARGWSLLAEGKPATGMLSAPRW